MSRKGLITVLLIGTTVLVLECAAGYYYNVYVGYYHSDGISRVANAFYVLYSRDPHLGAIGFVWNPLPSFINLIFLLFYPWFPAMATKGIAGLLMSAMFASLTAVLITRTFLKRGLSIISAVLFSLLFCLNPMVFIFGFNGLSDAPFMFFIILSIFYFLNWLDDNKIGDLAIASFGLALAFWCRYEAVPFGFSIALCAVIVVLFVHKHYLPPNETPLQYKWSRAGAVLSVIATPLLYSILLWILLNAIIMGNPFYFLEGEYSNISQIEGHLDNPVFAAMINNPLNAFIYAMQKAAVFSLPLLSILVLKLLNRRLFQWDTLILLGMVLSVPALQVIMLVKGTTLAWLRYFIYVLPVSFAWLPYELSKIRRKWQVMIPLVAMIANFAVLSYVITQPQIAPDENTFLQNSFGKRNQTYYDQRQWADIAEYLDKNYFEDNILVDSFSAYFIILQSKYPGRFYISSDYDFHFAISNPQKYDIDYMLIPKPGSASVISAINNAYPNLFEHGAEWAELEKDFDGKWRLYKMTGSTEGALSSTKGAIE